MRVAVLAAICAGCAGNALADSAALDALNAFRTDNGRSTLQYSVMLEQAARAHAQDMAEENFFSHTGSDGSAVADRVARAGYGWCVVAENIAKGQESLTEVMAAWAGSEGHRRNMLSREVAEFALVQDEGNIWVMVLASSGC